MKRDPSCFRVIDQKKARVYAYLAFAFVCSLLLVWAHHSHAKGADAAKQIYQPDKNHGWRVLPIRSEEEFRRKKIGGEAEQHPHGIARCFGNPNYIYLSQDVSGTWRSVDAGETWKKTLDIGLWVNKGQSIEVDPVNPLIVFLISDNDWNWLAAGYQGLYRSKDGGDSWEYVLKTETNFNSDRGFHRNYRHAIAYDPSSASSKGARTWYAAFPEKTKKDRKPYNPGGLFRSDDGGNTWEKTYALKGHKIIYSIKTHPSDGKTIFLASDSGLFASRARGSDLESLGDLPAGPVTSIEINPVNQSMIYATVKGAGLFRSMDGGKRFILHKEFKAARVFINPGRPDTMYLIGLSKNAVITHDGGNTWIDDVRTRPFPGLGRDKDWKSKIEGELTGVVPNPRDSREAVAFSRATLWKTIDGGRVFKDSSTLFTGYAWSWWNGGAAFDPTNPSRFAFFNNDVGMTITNTGGDYFHLRNEQAWGWYQERLISWVGAYAGTFQPIKNSRVIIASVGGYFNTQLMRSVDEGRTWTILTDKLHRSEDTEMNLFVAFHPQDPNFVYAGNKISVNAGESFQKVDFAEFNKDRPSMLGMCLSHPDTVYAMNTGKSYIIRSDDRGKTWRKYTQPGWKFARVDPLPTFAVNPKDSNIIYTIDASGDLAVFNGSGWRSGGVLKLAGGDKIGNFVRTIAVDANHPEILYAGMLSSGISCIWRSVNGGTNWEDITRNLPRTGMSAMAVNPHTGELFMGSCTGTWIFPPPYKSKNLVYGKLAYPAGP
jgi:hypothetical protein